jgi:alpha-tubulin suppressor-like RCC1 family protein
VATATLGCGHDNTAPAKVATQLVFATQPGAAFVGAPIHPAIVVTAKDASGAVVQSFVGAVTLALGTSPAGATLWGTATVSAVAGVATFDNVALSTAASGYTLVASSAVLTSTTSPPFAVSSGATDSIFKTMALGLNFACRLSAAGVAYCWGNNAGGELGNGTTAFRRSLPTVVVGGIVFTSLTAGQYHTCGLTAAGAAYCWGDNIDGQLGDGTTTSRLVPVPVAGGGPFVSLTAGIRNHMCGLTASGAAFCWGSNTNGQLGDGSTVQRLTPVAVQGAISFTTLSAGYAATCGLDKTGTAYCWGINDNGEVGDGTTIQRLAPVTVEGGLRFRTITVGGAQGCGLTSSGAAYCWGGNAPDLGNGDVNETHAPVAVVGGYSFASIVAGGSHTCGVTTAGTAYCWGYNPDGQLGDSTSTNRFIPVAVSGGLSFATLFANSPNTCGLIAGGAAYCWGNNAYGQLGNPIVGGSAVPVRVVP